MLLINQKLKIAVFLVPFLIVLFFMIVKMKSFDTYHSIVREDSLVEYIQAFLFFVSSIISLIVSTRLYKKGLILHSIMYMILFAGLFFIFIEEISWGQRIFDVEVVGYFKDHNVQNEITVHNLDSVQPHVYKLCILIGLYGTFAWLFIYRLKLRDDHILNFMIPEWFISSYFFSELFVNVYYNHIRSIFDIPLFTDDQELAELLLSLGFIIFTITNLRKTDKLSNIRGL